MARPNAELLATLARQLGDESELDGVLHRVVDAAVAQIDGAEHAGITSLSHKKVATPVATDDLVRKIDRHQYIAGEGPCLSAALEQQPIVQVDDLAVDQRWPAFSSAVEGLGVRSMLSFQLYTENGAGDSTIGAMNIYAARPRAFTAESVETGTLLAAHAAVAAAATAKSSNLRVALQSRDVIGQAKGILMERYKITAEQAFDLLIAASQHTHRKLNHIAADLAATGDLATD